MASGCDVRQKQSTQLHVNCRKRAWRSLVRGLAFAPATAASLEAPNVSAMHSRDENKHLTQVRHGGCSPGHFPLDGWRWLRAM